MAGRREIRTLGEFEEIQFRLADFFERLAKGTTDTNLAVEPDRAKWWPQHYEEPGTGRPLYDFGFHYVSQILRSPQDPEGWQRSPPDKGKGEKFCCWIHRHKYSHGDENLYVKITIIENPFKDDPHAEFQVLLWSCHGNKDDVF